MYFVIFYKLNQGDSYRSMHHVSLAPVVTWYKHATSISPMPSKNNTE